jgi:hypothetical protein
LVVPRSGPIIGTPSFLAFSSGVISESLYLDCCCGQRQ